MSSSEEKCQDFGEYNISGNKSWFLGLCVHVLLRLKSSLNLIRHEKVGQRQNHLCLVCFLFCCFDINCVSTLNTCISRLDASADIGNVL